ncbi:MAG: damage-inducible protein CinA [Bdellovibrionales bacterium RIFCSPHIGHO2_01_FULL_40_29]|nr:MAG: damage-inducible protein CinA [Bdellovibrionales bacterium RIFCSPHIGHO2_01_FULL_40_29]OFZ35420.1 MAG: damage-inducible protein CinA [Bdellovibrionales bacterium RIFCSPHIGHO2_02_FULL_40_15]
MKVQTDTSEIQLVDSTAKLVQDLRDKNITLGCSESCTGGLLSSFLTLHAGVSEIFFGSIVSYANSVKVKLLNVSPETLSRVGAVSSETAKQMAEGCQQQLEVSLAVSITGIAGPAGGSPEKPVGTVFIAVTGLKRETQVFEHHFKGARKEIQLQACAEAVKHLTEFIE